MRRFDVSLPFIVPIVNVLLDWFLARRIGYIFTVSQLVPSVGIAKYLLLPHDAKRSRYNRFVLLYFAFILGSLSVLKHMMRGVRSGIFLLVFAGQWVTSDFFAIYMVILRVAAIQPEASLVSGMQRAFWIVLVVTLLILLGPLITILMEKPPPRDTTY